MEKSLPESYLRYLHEVSEALLTEDIREEAQLLLVFGPGVQPRGEMGQSLMQPCRS